MARREVRAWRLVLPSDPAFSRPAVVQELAVLTARWRFVPLTLQVQPSYAISRTYNFLNSTSDLVQKLGRPGRLAEGFWKPLASGLALP
jgi:hypothetical protein